MSNLLIILGIFVLAKFTINLSRYIACNKYHKDYDAYLKNPNWKIEEIQPQIARLFKEAGVEDNSIAHAEYVGYNHIATSEFSVLENISLRRQDVAQNVTAMFHRAKGIYRSRMFDAINPLYWLLFFIFLPRNIIQYIGASPESVGVKTAQVIYWLFGTIGGVLVSVYGDEIKTYISKFVMDTWGIK